MLLKPANKEKWTVPPLIPSSLKTTTPCSNYTSIKCRHISDNKPHSVSYHSSLEELWKWTRSSHHSVRTEAALLLLLHQHFVPYLQESETNKSEQVAHNHMVRNKPRFRKTMHQAHAWQKQKGRKEGRSTPVWINIVNLYSHFFSVNWWSKQDFPTPMSPVTERTVKADTTSLSQEVHFVHCTQEHRQAASPPSGPVRSILCLATAHRSYQLSHCNFGYRCRFASEGGTETHRDRLHYWLHNCFSRSRADLQEVEVQHTFQVPALLLSPPAAGKHIENADRQPEHTKKLLHFHWSPYTTPTVRDSKIFSTTFPLADAVTAPRLTHLYKIAYHCHVRKIIKN